MKYICNLFLKLALLMLVFLLAGSLKTVSISTPNKAWLAGSNLLVSFCVYACGSPSAVLLIDLTNEYEVKKNRSYVHGSAPVTDKQLSNPKQVRFNFNEVAFSNPQHPDFFDGEIVGGCVNGRWYPQASSHKIYSKWRVKPVGNRHEKVIVEGLSDEICTGIEEGDIAIVSLVFVGGAAADIVNISWLPLSQPTYFYDNVSFYFWLLIAIVLFLWYSKRKRKAEESRLRRLQKHLDGDVEQPAP